MTNRVMSILILLLMLAACQPSTGHLGFEDAWVRAAPPGAMMMAAFGRFENDTGSTLVLTGFDSPEFRDVSLHRTVQHDGVGRMESVSQLEIEQGGSVLLQPGGLHLMFHGPVNGVQAGDKVHFAAADDAGNHYGFEVAVEKR